MLLFTYVGNKEETKDRCKDSKDNLNYGQDICSEGYGQVWTGTPINIPRGSEGVDVIANDFQTQCSGDDRKGNEGKNLKLKQTNRVKVTSKELKSLGRRRKKRMNLYQASFLPSPLPRGVARPRLGRPSFEQTTYDIQVAKTPWQYLGRKSHCWKSHFFKICFVVKYFRQRLLSLVNMGRHAATTRLSPLIHEGEQRYKPYIVGDPRMV